MSTGISLWRVGTQFLSLAESACLELSATGNKHVVVSNKPLSEAEYNSATKWSDHTIGIAILFNFFHGTELILKGFISQSANKAPKHHLLTDLLRLFRNDHPDTKLEGLLTKSICNLDPKSPLGRFLSSNGISVNDWYQALKYPESTSGQSFDHSELRYGGHNTASFWKSLAIEAYNIRYESVQLARSLGYVP